MERRHTIFTMNQKKNEKKSKTKTNSHNKMDIKLMTRAEKRVYTGAVENFQRLKLHCHSYNSLVPRLSAAVIQTAKNRKMTQLGRGIQSQNSPKLGLNVTTASKREKLVFFFFSWHGTKP
jgi:hypothetical protein